MWTMTEYVHAHDIYNFTNCKCVVLAVMSVYDEVRTSFSRAPSEGFMVVDKPTHME